MIINLVYSRTKQIAIGEEPKGADHKLTCEIRERAWTQGQQTGIMPVGIHRYNDHGRHPNERIGYSPS
jgi:hypothetical protein